MTCHIRISRGAVDGSCGQQPSYTLPIAPTYHYYVSQWEYDQRRKPHPPQKCGSFQSHLKHRPYQDLLTNNCIIHKLKTQILAHDIDTTDDVAAWYHFYTCNTHYYFGSTRSVTTTSHWGSFFLFSPYLSISVLFSLNISNSTTVQVMVVVVVVVFIERPVSSTVRWNFRWLKGGGEVCAVRRTKGTSTSEFIATVYIENVSRISLPLDFHKSTL